MAKLVFYYSSMNAGKTTRLLQVAHSYSSTGKRVCCLLPDIDTRFGEERGVIKSRIGAERQATIIPEGSTDFVSLMGHPSFFDVILVDEVQFLNKEQIQALSDLVDEHNVTVLCYGLRLDFMGNSFEGSNALFECADLIEEIKGVCCHPDCTKRSTHNLKVVDGVAIKHGIQFEIGAESQYFAVCRSHWKKGEYI